MVRAMWLQFAPYFAMCVGSTTQGIRLIGWDFPTHHRQNEGQETLPPGLPPRFLSDLHVMQVSTTGELSSASGIAVTVQACLPLYLSINCCTMH